MRRVRSLAAVLLLAGLATPAKAQSDSSSWTSDKVLTPAERAGGPKLLKTSPVQAPGRVRLPALGETGVITTKAPTSLPILPSEAPKDSSSIAKTDAGADPAYEAFDLGRYVAARDLATAAAERGEPQAATLLGRIYQEGLGVPHDDVKAAQWYRRGAELGDINAKFAFGVMLAEGGALKKDRAGAGLMFELAAAKGHVLASYNLALLFLTGDGKPENPRRGFQLIEYAAEAGLVQAQYDLATLYATGTGVDPNAFKAATWFKRSAEAGLPEAQLDFGVLLFAGKGIARDKTQGAEMFRLAADKGNPVAQYRYAICQAYGEGVAPNPAEAAKWYLIAKPQGLEDPALEKILAKLTKPERQKAEQAAATWREETAVR